MLIIYCVILILPSRKRSKYEYSLSQFNRRILRYRGTMLLPSNLVEIFVNAPKEEELFSHERGWKDLPLQSKNLCENVFER